MIYFTSDLHFGHSNIIKLCNRPFATVEEMDRALMEGWNKKVKKCDTVYIIGDIIWDKKLVEYYIMNHCLPVSYTLTWLEFLVTHHL